MNKIAFYTLGCKVNQVETEQLKEEFIHRGYEIVDFTDEADVYLMLVPVKPGLLYGGQPAIPMLWWRLPAVWLRFPIKSWPVLKELTLS